MSKIINGGCAWQALVDFFFWTNCATPLVLNVEETGESPQHLDYLVEDYSDAFEFSRDGIVSFDECAGPRTRLRIGLRIGLRTGLRIGLRIGLGTGLGTGLRTGFRVGGELGGTSSRSGSSSVSVEISEVGG
jgi:hypothetical protein